MLNGLSSVTATAF